MKDSAPLGVYPFTVMLTKDGVTARELEVRLKQPDQTAWEQVMREYNGPLTRYLASFCPNAPEDAVQTVWLRAFKAIHTYDSNLGQFQSWLFAIARNAGLDEIRIAERSRTVAVEPEQLNGFADPAPHHGFALGIHDAIVECIRHLSRAERLVVGAKVFGWTGDKEVAGKLNTTTGNVHTMRFRALAKLAGCLAKKGFEQC